MSSTIASTRFYAREGVATTAAVDVFELTLSSLGNRVAGLHMSQSSDVGDAAEEIIRYRYVYGNTSSGSGGAAADNSDAGYGAGSLDLSASVESFNTTPASGGSAENGIPGSWNIRAGEQMWYPPGCEPILQPVSTTEVNVVRLMAAPADSLTMTACIWVYQRADVV